MTGGGGSMKYADYRAVADAQAAARAKLPPRKPKQVYNKPERAAKGRGVPPSQKGIAPHFATPLFVDENSWLLTRYKDENGAPVYCIIDKDGDVYVESGRMVDVLNWLAAYAQRVDEMEIAANVADGNLTDHEASALRLSEITRHSFFM